MKSIWLHKSALCLKELNNLCSVMLLSQNFDEEIQSQGHTWAGELTTFEWQFVNKMMST